MIKKKPESEVEPMKVRCVICKHLADTPAHFADWLDAVV
jgi:hypothetical protein